MTERATLDEMLLQEPRDLSDAILLESGVGHAQPGRKARVQAVRGLLYRLGVGKELEWRTFGRDDGYGRATQAAVKEFARVNGYKKEFEKDGTIITRQLLERMLALGDALEPLKLLASAVDAKPGRVAALYKKGGNEEQIRGLQSLLKLLRLKPPVFESLKLDGSYPATGRQLDRFAASNLGTGNNATALSEGMARHLLTRLTESYGKDWSTAKAPKPPAKPKPPKPPKPPEPKSKKKPRRGQDEVKDKEEVRVRVDRLEHDQEGWALSTRSGITARLLALEPKGQQQEFWCWAASSQMVVGYLRSLREGECPTCGRTGAGDHAPSQGALANLRGPKTEMDCSKREHTEEWFDACDHPNVPYFYEFEGLKRSTEWAGRRHVLEEHGLQLVAGGPRLKLSHPLSDWQLKNTTYNSSRQFQKRLARAEGCGVSWETLTRLLDARRPVAFSFRFRRGGGAHMRVAAGYAVTSGHRWVVVCDPLPPGTGERYLIPYEYYKEGPFGGHLRDYWIAPVEEGATDPPRPTSEELRVGKELVACYRPEPTEDEEVGKELYQLTPTELAAAREAAEEGLKAVEEIATCSKELAAMLGMGGNFFQVFGATVVATAADREIHPESSQHEVGPKDVAAEDLKLAEEPVPIYEVTQHELREWDRQADGIGGLLGRPRELIWEVQRPKLEPFSFFACVTVRRHGDGWRLASLGKTFLMATFAQRQLMSSLMSFTEADVPFSFRRLLKGLWKLGLLEPMVRVMPEDDLKVFADGLGYPKSKVTEYLKHREGSPPGTLDVEFLLERAAELDRGGREERKNQRAKELAEQRSELTRKQYDITLEFLQQRIARGRKALKSKRAKLNEASRAGDRERVEKARVELDKERRALDGKLDKDAGWVLRGGKQRREAFLKWASHGTDEQTARAFKRVVECEAKIEEEMRTKPAPDLDKLLELRRDRDIAWLRERIWRQAPLDEQKLEALEKWSKTAGETAQEEFQELVRRQKELDGFVAAHPPTAANSTEQLRLIWEAQAALRRMQPMIPYLSRLSCQEATKRLTALESAKRLDAQERQDEPEAISIEKPKFILDIQDLYQLLIGYSNEKLVPAYPETFHRPGRRVEGGALIEVLKKLQQVAQDS